MRTHRERNTASQMLIGFVVIVAGFLFLVDNLGWIHIDMQRVFWPIIMVVAGVASLAQSSCRRSGASIAGVLLLLFGITSLLNGLGLISIGWDVLFPLAIIGVGLMVVFRARNRKEALDMAGPAADSDEKVLDLNAILGGFQRKVTTQDFRGAEVTAIMGGCDLDMRTASLNGTAVINVFALMGGISIKVPTDWSVELQGTPILGGFEEKTVQPKDESKRLVVRGTAIMGGVEIRN